MRLDLTILDESFAIDCHTDLAPRTLARLAGLLPLPAQLHTPKIAGSHIYWHAPFVEAPEGSVDVLSAQPGAFIYWPVRQFLEITFAPLQAETASVTVLGQLDGPVERVTELAARLRREQGRTLFDGALSLTDPEGVTPLAPFDHPSLPDTLQRARDMLWAACPADIATLRDSRAIMHPAGPVFAAESEARVLHETLWWLRERLATDAEANLRYAGALASNKAATRLRDFCHMTSSADALFALERAFADPGTELAALVDLGIVIAGRIAAWLDLQIAWDPINEAYRATLDA
ncbi:hypothetical protein [Alloyangia pacifica]|uniref:hypothetical protein n=1 Tax=Alloyangia pacifica TaxID=311180 RepID=UPI001CFD0E9E|nr:hypothetical protein [Alloyangia pacifica]